jgi:hypothetical protein
MKNRAARNAPATGPACGAHAPGGDAEGREGEGGSVYEHPTRDIAARAAKTDDSD